MRVCICSQLRGQIVSFKYVFIFLNICYINFSFFVFWSALFFISFLPIFLHPKKTVLLKALVYYSCLVFSRFGEYISLDLFYLGTWGSSLTVTSQ